MRPDFSLKSIITTVGFPPILFVGHMIPILGNPFKFNEEVLCLQPFIHDPTEILTLPPLTGWMLKRFKFFQIFFQHSHLRTIY